MFVKVEKILDDALIVKEYINSRNKEFERGGWLTIFFLYISKKNYINGI